MEARTQSCAGDFMDLEILRPDSKATASTSSTEIEFALVLSRVIDSVANDPEHLRATVYELARYKLKEQFGADTSADIGQLSSALEVAIQSVENFVKNSDKLALPRSTADRQSRIFAYPGATAEVATMATAINTGAAKWRFRFAGRWWFGGLLAIMLLSVVAIRQRSVLFDVVSRPAGSPKLAAPDAKPAPQLVLPANNPAPPAPDPLTPTVYGVYAVSANKLYELEMLPGRAPDIRVSISAAILTPSKTVLPDGHLKFVVYRRDSGANAVDRADVRLIARVAQQISFDKSGKPVTSKVNDTWVIRNISIPFRTAPKRDHPEMYDVQGEGPDVALNPGRYALVLKDQAFDFTVAGQANDARQCLERLTTTNGQFYSQCQKR